MVLRRVQLPLAASLEALDAHLAHLQEAGRWVLLVTNRLPADVIARGLHATDMSRLAVIDTTSAVPPAPVPGLLVEHVAGSHLLELLHLRSRRLIQRLPQPPHVVYYDANTLNQVVPRQAIEEMTRGIAMVSTAHTWTDVVVHDRLALPGWQKDLYDEFLTETCRDCEEGPARLVLQASP